jgi:amidohydrolase
LGERCFRKAEAGGSIPLISIFYFIIERGFMKVQMDITKKIIDKGNKLQNELSKIRRWIHQHPELSKQEFETSKFIAKKLETIGLLPKTGIAGTGITAMIEGDIKGKTIALRADMDALPISEANDVPYKSKNEGVMHACGHDVHITYLIGTAMILMDPDIKNILPGNVKLLFQPSEESFPGGANKMIQDGVLENPIVESVVAGHVYPFLDSGKIGFKDEVSMAAIDDFDVEIIGESCHASTPHLGKDAIIAAANCITGVQNIISRRKSPLDPAVLSIGVLRAGTKSNIIADKANFKGTVRTINPDTRLQIRQMFEATIKNIALAHGCEAKINYQNEYGAVYNNPKINRICRSSVAKIGGENAVVELKEPMMGSEDFAYFADKLPCTIMRVGCLANDREFFPLHHNRFDIDETILPFMAKILSQISFDLLDEFNKGEKN